jgi:hypothetical protein
MHTDEYEISTGREISLCRKAIGRLQKALLIREKKFGMTTEAFLQTLEQDLQGAKKNPDFAMWLKDQKELKIWEQRLKDYEQTLEVVKRI